jgi:hypothetical protein
MKTKIVMLLLIRDGIFIGEAKSDAQKILNDYFPADKASAYMAEIQKDLQGLLAP